uniref:hypothetical protein n=1 Tax=Paenibacillus alginolyticus TaxID=59839 RepID=UPI001FE9730C|nr:hypothetical protein [Paenibacillus frigoriresistens]
MGLLLGPLIGGFLATQLSIPVVFVINGCLLLLVAVLLKLPKFSFQRSTSVIKEMSK